MSLDIEVDAGHPAPWRHRAGHLAGAALHVRRRRRAGAAPRWKRWASTRSSRSAARARWRAPATCTGDGLPVVGVPKTIDNDIDATELTFGFDTAVQIATEAIDRLHTTAESHDRVIVVEVMGRHVGHIATWAGIAGGATMIARSPRSRSTSTRCARRSCAATRGAATRRSSSWPRARSPCEGTMAAARRPRSTSTATSAWAASPPGSRPRSRSGTGFETRVTALGHVQRGGTPTAFDRVLSTRFGVAAIDAVHDGAFGQMVALQGGRHRARPAGRGDRPAQDRRPRSCATSPASSSPDRRRRRRRGSAGTATRPPARGARRPVEDGSSAGRRHRRCAGAGRLAGLGWAEVGEVLAGHARSWSGPPPVRSSCGWPSTRTWTRTGVSRLRRAVSV